LTDYYKILGVLPEAEDIVIKAAYKALAQCYHPDKWSGDPAEANRRMAAINEAYGVLSDTAKRKQYDQNRSDAYQPDDDTGNNDAAEGMASLASDWELAVRYYPSLNDLLAKLQRIDKTLGFTFMLILLENQLFAKGAEVALVIETEYLTKYFGSNVEIRGFAKELLLEGARSAAKELNKTVKVLGSSLDLAQVISTIAFKYNTKRSKEFSDKAAYLERVRKEAIEANEARQIEIAASIGSSLRNGMIAILATVFFVAILILFTK
jgi:curved DNA-binding protein CbpA